MSSDMLGKIVSELVRLPSEVLGVVYDFVVKLKDPEWVEAAKKFLRKEEVWPAIQRCASKVYGTFQLMLEGKATATELVQRGQYNWHNDWITDERFPLQPHEPMSRTIELIKFDHNPTAEEVLAEFVRHGLERPTTEDAFYFGIQHSEEQRKRPIVFLHEPVLVPDGSSRVLVLGGRAGVRELFLLLFEGRWGRSCVFAGVRK